MRNLSRHLGFRSVLGALLTIWLGPSNGGAQERAFEWSWGMHPMGWMWGAWGFGMMLMMLVFWGLLIAGIVVGIRWLARQGGSRGIGLMRPSRSCVSGMHGARSPKRTSTREGET